MSIRMMLPQAWGQYTIVQLREEFLHQANLGWYTDETFASTVLYGLREIVLSACVQAPACMSHEDKALHVDYLCDLHSLLGRISTLYELSGANFSASTAARVDELASLVDHRIAACSRNRSQTVHVVTGDPIAQDMLARIRRVGGRMRQSELAEAFEVGTELIASKLFTMEIAGAVRVLRIRGDCIVSIP